MSPHFFDPSEVLQNNSQWPGIREKMQIRTILSLLVIQLGLLKKSLTVAEYARHVEPRATSVPAPIVVAASQNVRTIGSLILRLPLSNTFALMYSIYSQYFPMRHYLLRLFLKRKTPFY